MSLTVLLARHGTHDEVGQVLSGRSEIALNAEGRGQAQRLTTRLAGIPITEVHTSPRRRARETAQIIAAQRSLDPITVDAFDEIDFGAWTGRSFAALDGDPRWRLWNAERGITSTPGGDTMASVIRRATRHLETCADDGAILCVSHCDVIRGLVAHYRGWAIDRVLSFDIDPASITTLDIRQGAARVIAVNERIS